MSNEEPLTPFENALAGALGGVFANATTYPLDTSKTRLQAGSGGSSGNKVVDPVLGPNAGLFSGVLRIARSEGIQALYKGFGANMVNAFLTQFAYFYAYANVRRVYFRAILRIPPGTKRPVLSTAMELVLGALAAAISQLFTIPVNVVATRQQLGSSSDPSSPRTHKLAGDHPAGVVGKVTHKAKSLWLELVHDEESIVGVTRDIYREDGITGFWRGLRPSLVLCSNPAITYGVFARVKNIVLSASGDAKMTPSKSFVVGAMSKSLATVVTFPMILAKVLQMTQKSTDGTQIKSAPAMLLHIAKTQGISGWYQGMQAQITKAVITQALLFYARDYLEVWTRVLLKVSGAKA